MKYIFRIWIRSYYNQKNIKKTARGEDKLTKMKWYVVRTQKERKSVSEKIIKEGEIGEVGRSGQVLVPLEKTFYLKIIKVQRETILPGYIFMQTSSLGELKYYLKGKYIRILTERNGEIQS
jgi:CTP-dependent riboflavin kinase